MGRSEISSRLNDWPAMDFQNFQIFGGLNRLAPLKAPASQE